MRGALGGVCRETCLLSLLLVERFLSPAAAAPQCREVACSVALPGLLQSRMLPVVLQGMLVLCEGENGGSQREVEVEETGRWRGCLLLGTAQLVELKRELCIIRDEVVLGEHELGKDVEELEVEAETGEGRAGEGEESEQVIVEREG
jgi:hypothetical protein